MLTVIARPKIWSKSSMSFLKGSVKTTACKIPKRYQSVTGYQSVDRVLDVWLLRYEDFVGLTEVKQAQTGVLQAEEQMQRVQQERRRTQKMLSGIQDHRKTIERDLDRTSRGTDHYLELVTEENAIIKKENDIDEQLRDFEEREHQTFNVLQSAVRDSHEKERARAERTKYWPVTFSVVSIALSVVGATLSYNYRIREQRKVITSYASTAKDYQDVITKLCDSLNSQHEKMESFALDVKSLIGGANKAVPKVSVSPESLQQKSTVPVLADMQQQMLNILLIVNKNEQALYSGMQDIKQLLLSVNRGRDSPTDGSTVVYVGPEMQSLLNITQERLERNSKLNTIATVTLIYGAVAVAIPLVYFLFKGVGG